MSKSSDEPRVSPARRAKRRAAGERSSGERSAGETVFVRDDGLERRVHTLAELDRGDPGARPRYRYRRAVWCWLFAAIDAIGWLAVAAIRSLAHVRPRASSDPGQVRSILLIQLDHLGDGVLTCSVLPALRRRFPDARITALVGPSGAELFRDRPEVDETLVCERNRFSRDGRGAGWLAEIVRWGRTLRPRRFDAAIDFRGEFPHALLMWLAGARIRVGWDCGGGGFLLTHRVAYAPHRHEVLSRWAVVRTLGVRRPRGVDALGPRRASRATIASDAGPRDADAKRVVCHLGAGTSAKRWPVGHWKRLVAGLLSRPDVRVVLVGGEADVAAAASIAAESPADRLENRVGRSSLAELWELVAGADLVIGADSGPAHVAAAAGTATLTLFSGTNDVRQWRPWGASARVIVRPVACSPCHSTACRFADHPCLVGVSPELVLEEAWRVLDPRTHDQAAEGERDAPVDPGYPRFPARMYRRVRGDGAAGVPVGRRERASAAKRPRIAPAVKATRLSSSAAWTLALWGAAVGAIYLWRVVLGGSWDGRFSDARAAGPSVESSEVAR